ncbi:DMT family transporter [Lutispora sp.]|uniref:DMT family transporter n=1 Tax=Lutispora sp. TaxID=2828727 RepID=UPI002B205349|nr:DMT family transporter [Lutispora sp.]MEA4962567.1 DMT family transporter [Lutispora sp.]
MVDTKLKGYFYLGITILIFSTLEVVSSSLKGLIHPTQLIFIRFLIGGLALLPWVIAKKEKISVKDWMFFAGLGILNTVISMGSLQLAISMGKASTAAILISSNPIFVVMFSYLLLKEKITKNSIICMILGIIGITLIIYKGGSGGDTAMSLFLGIVASLTFGLYSVLGKMKADNISSITMISLSAIIGAICTIPLLLYMGLPVLYFPREGFFRIMYLGLILSGFAYITFIEALKILSASKGSMVFFLKPAVATVLAVIFLGEKISAKTILGMAFVAAGILINFYKKPSADASKS